MIDRQNKGKGVIQKPQIYIYIHIERQHRTHVRQRHRGYKGETHAAPYTDTHTHWFNNTIS